MTLRSIILGIISAVVMAVITQFSDYIVKGGLLIGHYFPPVVFGSLVLFLLTLNPLLQLIRKAWALTGKELAVIMFCALCGAWAPSGGLMAHFSDCLVMPHKFIVARSDCKSGETEIVVADVKDWSSLFQHLKNCADGDTENTGTRILQAMPPSVQKALQNPDSGNTLDNDLQQEALPGLNAIIKDTTFWQKSDFEGIILPVRLKQALQRAREDVTELESEQLNRMLLDTELTRSLNARRIGPMEAIPPHLVVAPGDDYDTVVNGFTGGIGRGDEWISPRSIPWHAWVNATLFWLSMIVAMCAMVFGLSLVVHRQWSQHEHLPYPLAEVASMLMPDSDSRVSRVFKNRLFWCGFIPVALIYTNNYAYGWFQKYLIFINTSVNFAPLSDAIFPWFTGGFVGLLKSLRISFCIIGITYFVRTDVSLSFGLSAFVSGAVLCVLARMGIPINGGGYSSSGNLLWIGAFCGIFAAALYTGRRFYGSVFRRSLCLPCRDHVDSLSVWGGRIGIVSAGVLTYLMACTGLDWQLALLMVLSGIMVYVVTSRIMAETGIFIYKAMAFPTGMMLGFMGLKAIGPNNLILMMMITTMLFIAPMNYLMPFVLNGLKIVENKNVKLGRSAMVGFLALLIGLPVAFGASTYIKYQYGSFRAGDYYRADNVPRIPLTTFARARTELESQGTLQVSDEMSGWRRIASMSPSRPAMTGFAVMFLLVIALTFLRVRFPGWPIHPIFAVGLASSWVICWTAPAILLGWFIKFLVTKYGGGRLYQRLKPFMIGIISAEILAAFMPSIIGAVYYWITGEVPKNFGIFPS